MLKLCKWIYELGYKRGREDGYKSAQEDARFNKKLMEMLKGDEL